MILNGDKSGVQHLLRRPRINHRGNEIMKCRIIALGVLSFSLIFTTVAQAVDSNGNYTTADFFPPDNPNEPYALSTWTVISANLNCRKRPGITQPILRTFKKNDPLVTIVSEGSHDNQGFLKMDGQGKSWMKVSLTSTSTGICFVRANRIYISPVVKKP
jgi:hypothetical protein